MDSISQTDLPYPQHASTEAKMWVTSEGPKCAELVDNAVFRQLLYEYTGTPFSETACNYFVRTFDTDQDGRINHDELREMCSNIKNWSAVFNNYDKDKSNFIDNEELNTALKEMGFRFSQQLIAHIINSNCSNDDHNRINREEFIMMCVKLQRFTDQFRERDKNKNGIVTIDFEDFIKMTLNCIQTTHELFLKRLQKKDKNNNPNKNYYTKAGLIIVLLISDSISLVLKTIQQSPFQLELPNNEKE